MKIAYADPPYIGQARKHYNCNEIDHKELIKKLNNEFDTWALSCSTPTLKYLLSICPDDCRIAAWVKPFCSFKPGVNPAYAWEPVIYRGVRKHDRKDKTIRDWVSVNITLKKGLSGAKPVEFCLWLFQLLNIKPEEDEFYDLFPGTGIVTETYNQWSKEATHETKTEI